MKREIKDKWVAALLSGEYKQGKGALNSGAGFCCLGVLCDLAAKEGIGTWEAPQINGEDACFVSQDHRKYQFPPPPVLEWAGLRSEEAKVFNTSLAYENDNGDVSFEDIACAIEGCWEDL